MMKAGFLCLALCAALAPNAHAQMTWTDKAFANVTFGAQAGSHDLTTAKNFDLYGENATVASAQEVKGGAFFDISAAYKVRRNLLAGLGYSHVGSKKDVVLTGLIPDPDVTDNFRPVIASASNLKHSENAINLFAAYMVPVTDKIDVGLSAGPSIFFVRQDLPAAVTVSEPGPTVSSVTIEKNSKTTAGINIGVDVTYLMSKRWGFGGLARYTWGSVDLKDATDNLTVGGFQIGVGLRMRMEKLPKLPW